MTFDKDKLENIQSYDFIFESINQMNKSMQKLYRGMDEAYEREREDKYESKND